MSLESSSFRPLPRVLRRQEAGVGKSTCSFFGVAEGERRVDLTSHRSVYIMDTIICSLITLTAVGNSLQKDQGYDVVKKG